MEAYGNNSSDPNLWKDRILVLKVSEDVAVQNSPAKAIEDSINTVAILRFVWGRTV